MSDDEIALKLMRLYKMLRASADPAVRRSVCTAIDTLLAQLNHPQHTDRNPIGRQAALAQEAFGGDD